MALRSVLRALALTAAILPVDGLFWTVTKRYQYYMSVETDTYTWRSTNPYYYWTYTSTATLNSGVTPTVTPLSSTTSSDTYQNIELVSLYYQTGAVPDSDLIPTTTASTTTSTTTTYTQYSMAVTYTPPASCSKTWKYTTSVSVYIPSEVRDQITPISVITSTGYTITYSTGAYTGSPWETWLLSDGAAPMTTTGWYADYYYTRDVMNCKKPGSSSSTNYDSDDIKVCTLYSGCTSLKTWIIIVATLLSTLFVLGWIESYFWFRRLMTGRSALRFGTVCWVLISLWVLCFTRRQKARPVQDHVYLKQQWSQLSFGRRLKLWFKWGFRHSYPTALLGEYVPPAGTVVYRSGQPIRGRDGQLADANGNGGFGPPPGMPPPAYTGEAGRNIEVIQPMPTPAPYIPGGNEEKPVGNGTQTVQEIPGYQVPHEASGRDIPHEAPSTVPSVPPPSKQQ
ncbi:hypothetical protein P154DRAFT_516783 [Amniculicola lignicola CBS 123094]|uniref:Uncharacterized protein n=1 Tax=Amniculicola lignicola CBS 123094 TaxID=1392246 RepID=A0A6A5X550_9PLEO|nr:hypothetical protein P154DRAFT_516783 [Amniculicola lignicola CBS 123094]